MSNANNNNNKNRKHMSRHSIPATAMLPGDLIPCYSAQQDLPFLRRNHLMLGSKSQEQSTTTKKAATTATSKPQRWQFHTTRGMVKDPRVVTYHRKDYTCPLCSCYEAPDMETLWYHMVHTNLKYEFKALRDKEGMIHIAADPWRSVHTPRVLEHQDNRAFETEIIYERASGTFGYKLEKAGAESLEQIPSLEQVLASTVAPVRDYFHTNSFARISIGEWMLLEKIVLPSDDTWQLRIANSLLEDFNDVSSEEKHFMRLWNAFVRVPNRVITNQSLKRECCSFINLHLHIMNREPALYAQHLICFVTTLWEEHQLNREEMIEVMTHFRKALASVETIDSSESTAATAPTSLETMVVLPVPK